MSVSDHDDSQALSNCEEEWGASSTMKFVEASLRRHVSTCWFIVGADSHYVHIDMSQNINVKNVIMIYSWIHNLAQ